MALLTAAALDGIARDAPLPDPMQDDPAALSAAELAGRGIARLPATLGHATELFETSALARRALGDVLHDAFAAVRRREWETYGALSEDQAVAAYRWRY
jgi:glutamine synthetase